MEECSRMDTIPHLEQTPMIIYEETTTKGPPFLFLSCIFNGDLRESSIREGFLVLGKEVKNRRYGSNFF